MTILVASGSVVTDVRGDTLHLQAESIRSAGGRSERWDWPAAGVYGAPPRPHAALTVAVVPAAGDRVEAHRLDGRKTALAVLGTAAALVAAFYALRFMAYASGDST